MIDLLHLPKEDQYELVLIMIDVCSWWAIARPIRNCKSEEVARAANDA